jgi:large subunit ribosomal protein L35Ae
MEGTIAHFRRGRHTQNDKQMIVIVKSSTTKEKAKTFVGKEVIWKTSAKKELKGKVASSHGNKGALRVIFEQGMPGQAIGEKVDIK